MIVNYLLVFGVALVISLLLTPVFIKLAFRLGAVDQPGPRRVNKVQIARMGGPAIFIAFAAAVAIGRFRLHGVEVDGSIEKVTNWLPILAGAFIVLAVGLVDDLRSLPPFTKLLGQFLAACVAFRLGVRIEIFSNPFGGGVIAIPLWLQFVVTVFWLMGVTNALNLIDGLDGLAAGIVSIASLTFFLVAISRGQIGSALMALALIGAAGGFLRWNFFPSKIIMGDSGAYFLGFTVAALAVRGAFKSTTALTLLIPIFALGLPLADTSFAILRRLSKRQPVMSQPDKNHIHHRLLASGWHHREAVIICYIITLALSALSLAIIREWMLALYLCISVVCFTILLMIAGKIIKRGSAVKH